METRSQLYKREGQKTHPQQNSLHCAAAVTMLPSRLAVSVPLLSWGPHALWYSSIQCFSFQNSSFLSLLFSAFLLTIDTYPFWKLSGSRHTDVSEQTPSGAPALRTLYQEGFPEDWRPLDVIQDHTILSLTLPLCPVVPNELEVCSIPFQGRLPWFNLVGQ